jgi:hypothetical protein
LASNLSAVPISGLNAALGGSAIDELAEYEAFAVDDDDLATLRDIAQGRKQTTSTADGGKAGPPATNLANGTPSPFANGISSAAEGGPAAGGPAAAAADGLAAADAGMRAVSLRAVSMVSVADFTAGEFTYAGWAQEMSDMKVRRWKSLMPVLSAKSELTTREMVSASRPRYTTEKLPPVERDWPRAQGVPGPLHVHHVKVKQCMQPLDRMIP